MITTYLKSFKTPIYAKNTFLSGVPVGFLLDFVISPEKGDFQAIWVQSHSGMRLILVDEVLEWGGASIFVANEAALIRPDSVKRLERKIEKEIPILKNRVYDQITKEKLGRVVNFAFDTISPKILSLEVEWGVFPFRNSKIIPRKQIFKITKSGIFVSHQALKSDFGETKKKSLVKKKIFGKTSQGYEKED